MKQRKQTKLSKIIPVARKEGSLYYAELQGMSEYDIVIREGLFKLLQQTFDNAADAIKHGRTILEAMKIKAEMVKEAVEAKEQEG